MDAVHTLYHNGMIRNNKGVVIGFYDRRLGEVIINDLTGSSVSRYVYSDEEAMDMVAEVRGLK